MSAFAGLSGGRERLASLGAADDSARRRSSGRNIKRPKFDDELVESSLGGQGAPLSGKMRSKAFPAAVPECPVPATPSTSAVHDARKRIQTPKTPSNQPSKQRPRKGKSPLMTPAKDVAQWKPIDDLALIQGVQQTCDLAAIHRGVKFTCKFTLAEIQDRWHALLYDASVSRVAKQAIQNLHPEQITSIQSKALFSKAEEEVLASIKWMLAPELSVFQTVLQNHAHVFHPGRTARALFSHWLLMKQHNLLQDQTAYGKPGAPPSFEEFEQKLIESEQNMTASEEQQDELLRRENALASRANKLEIRRLEEKVQELSVLVEAVTGISQSIFDANTLAILKGRLVKFNMRSDNLTFGRCTKDCRVDIDLSLEGPAWKVSRRQGILSHREDGQFVLANEGRRAVFVDGKPVLPGYNMVLRDNSVVELDQLKFIFLINPVLLAGGALPVKEEGGE